MAQPHSTRAATMANTATAGDADAAWVRLAEAELAGWAGAPVESPDADGYVHDAGVDDRGGLDGSEDLFDDDPSGRAAVDGSVIDWFSDDGDRRDGEESGLAGIAPGVHLAGVLDAVPPAQLEVHELADAVAAWERIIAWATAKQAETAAALTRRPELRPDDGNGRYASLHPIPVTAGALCAVRPWTKPQAEKLVDHALTLIEDYPAVHAALFEGRLDTTKARILTRALTKCDPDFADTIQRAVLPFVHTWTDVKLSRVVNELLHELDAAGAKRRHREARSRRDVWVEPGEDGMAWLIAYLPAEEASAILAALNAAADTEARRSCEHSTTRTCQHHDQQEAASGHDDGDHGHQPDDGNHGHEPNGDGDTRNADRDSGQTGAGDRGGGQDEGCGSRTRGQRRADALASFGWSSLATGHLGGRVCAGCGAAAGTRLATAHGRPVTVNLTLPMTSLLGLDEHPAHLDGFGPIDADAARALAAAGVWRWVGTAPAGGHALDYGTTRYSPPQDLVDFVILRDRECVAPGCHRPAQRCEIDHRTPWPYGPTSACNCSALCKACHVQKHHAGWTVEHLGDGRQRWTSPTGHSRIVTIPRIAPNAPDTDPSGKSPGPNSPRSAARHVTP